jgi:hypothetical protein
VKPLVNRGFTRHTARNFGLCRDRCAFWSDEGSAHGERRQLDEALDEPVGNHNGMTRRAARLGGERGLSAQRLGYRIAVYPVGWTIRR